MFKLYSILIVRKGTSFSNGNENNKVNKGSIRMSSLSFQICSHFIINATFAMFKLYSILIVRKGTSFSNGNENNKINKVSIRIRSLFVFNRYYENQKRLPTSL